MLKDVDKTSEKLIKLVICVVKVIPSVLVAKLMVDPLR